MEDRRSTAEPPAPSAEQLLKGKAQLEAEIKVIESWLAELDETRKDNPESLSARKNYMDMLQSRRDLLQNLQRKQTS